MSENIIRAACIQLCSGTDMTANIQSAAAQIRRAAGHGATLIATPEMTHMVQRHPKALFKAIQPEDTDPGLPVFAALAKALGVYLLIGSLAIRTGDKRAVNRSFLFGPNGQIIARYDKIHLFDVTLSANESWQESRIYERGQQAVLCPAGPAMLGLSICYDLRFAGLYRAYAQAGAQILTIPAAFTRPTGQAHWETLLRARAIETGSYILAPAQGGRHDDGRQTWGRSMIIDPWGQVIAQLENDAPGLIWADIELDNVDQARRKIPAWQHDPAFTLISARL